MKRHINTLSAGLALTMALPLFSGFGTDFANAADTVSYAPPPVTMNPSVATTQGAPTVPANIDPQSPLAEVIKLAQAGVGESVIQSYIANSGTPFNLDSDQIIYLRDLGLSDATVNAMLQRDQTLGAPAPVATTPPPQPQTVTAPANPPPQDLPADETYFYDSLSPYGNWVDVEGVGPCWQPTVVYVNSGWQPYCDGGHWVYTDCGWYWTSDYSWGWAPFHYGRWFHDDHRGWCWSPDREWGPAWVTWRYSDNYCGWAPLPPGAGFRAGAGFTFHGRGVDANFGFGIGADFFTFVSIGNFTDRHPWEHREGRDHDTRVRIYNNTTVINNITVGDHNRIINNGFGHDRIETATHTTLHPIHVADNDDRNPAGERHERFEGGNLVVNHPPLNEHANNSGHNIPHFDTPPRNLPGNNNNNKGPGNGNNPTTGNQNHGNNPFINNSNPGNNNENHNAGNQPHNGSSPFTPAGGNNVTHDISAPVTSGGTPGNNDHRRTTFDNNSGPKVTTPSTPMTTPSTHMTTPSTHMTAPSTPMTTPAAHEPNPFINSGNNGGNNVNSGPINAAEGSHLRDNNSTRYNSPKIESQIIPPRHNVVEPTFPHNNPTVVAPSGGQPAHESGSQGGNGGGGGGNRGGNGGGNGGGGGGNGGGDKRNH